MTANPTDAERWYLGAMNDGLFIINTPPRPSNDDVWHDRPDGPTLILSVTELPQPKAQAVVDAHNAAFAFPAPTVERREESLEDIRARLPRYVSGNAREIASEAIDDMRDEQYDGGVYALARWIHAILALPVPDGAVLNARTVQQAKVPLADHDKIGRKILSLPWQIQIAIVTITSHCTALVDGQPPSEVEALAGCISQECDALTDAILSLASSSKLEKSP